MQTRSVFVINVLQYFRHVYNSHFVEAYPDVLTPNDIMQILSIGRNKVYELLNDGTLKSIRIGRKHRIPKKILIEFLENS